MTLPSYVLGRALLWIFEIAGWAWLGVLVGALTLGERGAWFGLQVAFSIYSAAGILAGLAACRIGHAIFDIAERLAQRDDDRSAATSRREPNLRMEPRL